MNQEVTNIVITPALRKLFENGWNKYRVLYFSAPCGVGKTTAAHALLAGHTVCACSATVPNLEIEENKNCEAVLIDDFHMIKDTEEQQAVCNLLNEYPNKRFLFLSRGVLPGWLMPYQFTGLLTTISSDNLIFDQAAIQELALKYNVSLHDSELTDLFKRTKGYPLLINLLCLRMKDGEPYGRELLKEGKRELFHYVEEAVYHRFPSEMRRLLVSLAPFDCFDSELAKIISGNSRVNDLLNQILHETTMLDANTLECYRFWPIFREFLLWELEQDLSVPEQNDLYRRAGLYYELHEDYPKAMDCYLKSDDHSKMAELLVKNAEQHPGMAHYYEMEQYYESLPKEAILRNPTLMCGMSMLSALILDFDASEHWYKELQSFAASLSKTDANYKLAKSKLLYLDIALPQRGSKGMVELITTVFRAITTKSVNIPEFSVTSTLPSIMNGGKDFCEWSKKDDLLYTTMKHLLEVVLGRDGIGLADCGICESKFEKGEDISKRLLELIARLNEIQRKGTPDISFAVIGLLARTQVMQGNAKAALHTLESVRNEFVDTGQTRFLPNIDAMRCRIWLRLGMRVEWKGWLREDAPSNLPHFRALWRYRYITKAMVQLADGNPEEAVLSITPLMSYCKQCGRTMDSLYLQIIMAIAHYRKKDKAWKEELNCALDTAYEYSFITPIGQFGAAVLPMLNKCGWRKDAAYFEKVRLALREQTVHYPDFMRPMEDLEDPLTPAEMQVLRLLCAHRSNQEICDILGVKMSTVKTQVRSILQKLKIERRSEAKDVAIRLHLI